MRRRPPPLAVQVVDGDDVSRLSTMCWTGNSAGPHRHFRRMLEEAGVGHVVGLPGSHQVASPTGAWRLAQPATLLRT